MDVVQKRFLIGWLLVISSAGCAQEVWLQSQKFQFAAGETAIINFLDGHDFIGVAGTVNQSGIKSLDHTAAGYSKSLFDKIPTTGDKNISVVLQQPGTHLFALQTSNELIELDAEQFNAFITNNSLDEVSSQRKKSNTQNNPTKEFFTQYGKLLVRAGTISNDFYKKKAGHRLEIVPVNDPYAAGIGEEISFLVLFDDKPLAFTLVKVWNQKERNTIRQNIYTQKDGIITTRKSNTGAWMVSTVKMIPSKDNRAEWQSYRASLTFGF